MRRHLISAAAAMALLTAGAAQAAQQTIYFSNFDDLDGGGDTIYPGVTGFSADNGGDRIALPSNQGGMSGGFYWNGTSGQTTLTLNNLPTHDSISISFLLAFVDSWDSFQGGDHLYLSVDGVDILDLTAANASGSTNEFGGGTQTYLGNFLDGFGRWGGWNDRVVDMTGAPALTFAHTNNSLVLGIRAGGFGWQNAPDESWGIDNFHITANVISAPGIPEPATWAMMILGFAGVGGALRSRRKAIVSA